TTFRDFFFGSEPRGPYRQILREATELSVFADVEQDARTESTGTSGASATVSQAERRLAEVAETLRVLSQQFTDLHNVFEELKQTQRGPARILPFKTREPAIERAKAVESVMYQLIAELETFRS